MKNALAQVRAFFLFLEIKEFTERTEKIKRRKKILKF